MLQSFHNDVLIERAQQARINELRQPAMYLRAAFAAMWEVGDTAGYDNVDQLLSRIVDRIEALEDAWIS